MVTKNSSYSYSPFPFFQTPKFLIQDKRLKGDYLFIIMILYEQLRQRPSWNKTNIWLSEITGIGMRQLKRDLNDLEEWGYITRNGMGANRKFTLGEKLINGDKKELGDKYNSDKKEPVQCQKGTGDRTESVLHNKKLFKNINKSKPQSQPQSPLIHHPEYHEYVMRIKSDINLGLKEPTTKILSFQEWQRRIDS